MERRSPKERAWMTLTVLATVGGACALVFGPALIALASFVVNGVTFSSVAWTVVAAVWLGLLLEAAWKKEAHGWLVFAVFGWLTYPRALVRRWRR